MYTSGTTGLPKGIQHTHFIRAMYATTMANAWRMAPESVVLHSGAIVFNGAMVTMFPAFMAGATYVLQRAFDADDFIDTVERERVTHTMLVPSQVIAILNAKRFDPVAAHVARDGPVPRRAAAEGAQGPPERASCRAASTSSTASPKASSQSSTATTPSARRAASACRRRSTRCGSSTKTAATCRRATVGEIAGRGPITMPGYYNRAEQTAEVLRDDWLVSGDLGYVDDEGFLYLVDRKKDMIDSGGVKVYPKDVEEIAAHHPAILEVAVFGIPHDKWGETPCAAVVLREPGSDRRRRIEGVDQRACRGEVSAARSRDRAR